MKIRKLVAALAVAVLLPLSGLRTASADPGDIDSIHEIPHYGIYECAEDGTSCDFYSWAIHITVPGDNGPHVLMHLRLNVHWTLHLPIRSHFRQWARVGGTRVLQSIITYGALRDASAGTLGNIWHACPDMGHTDYVAPMPHMFLTKQCESVDSSLRHHSAEIFVRFTILRVPGYYWLCHVWSPVARWYGSARIGRRGHYEFTGASNLAGWSHPPPDRELANAGKDHVHCDRFVNAGQP